jgi:vancomycin permeability regulator SanA
MSHNWGCNIFVKSISEIDEICYIVDIITTSLSDVHLRSFLAKLRSCWTPVAHTCNPSYFGKVKSGGLRFETSQGK